MSGHLPRRAARTLLTTAAPVLAPLLATVLAAIPAAGASAEPEAAPLQGPPQPVVPTPHTPPLAGADPAVDAGVAADPAPTVDPALAAVAAALALAPAWQGRFTLDQIPAGDAQVDPERRRSGEFALAGGGRFHLRHSAADGFDAQRWCSDGVSTWVIERAAPDDAPAVRLAHGADLDLARRLAAALRLDLAVLGRSYRIAPLAAAPAPGSGSPTAPPSGARFTARDPQDDPQTVEVTLVDGRPRQVLLRLAAGERLILTIDRLDRLESADPRWFSP